MRSWIMMVVWASAACGSVRSQQTDAGPPADSPQPDTSSPGGAICDPAAKFDTTAALTTLNTDGVEYAPRLTGDELEIYFARAASGTSTFTLYRAQRASVRDPFAAPVALDGVHTAAGEFDPSVSSDGLTIFFRSIGTDQGTRLYVATRTSRLAEFMNPSKIANIASPTAADNDIQPYVTADGKELWFASNRSGGLGSYDMYRATSNGTSFASVAAVKELNAQESDEHPTLSADRLTIYFASIRPGGPGKHDLWAAHRSTVNDGFAQPTLVTELNTTGHEFPGWLSADNCRLYFSSEKDGTFDLHVASRRPM